MYAYVEKCEANTMESKAVTEKRRKRPKEKSFRRVFFFLG